MSRYGSSGNSGTTLPDVGNSSSLRNTVSARSRKWTGRLRVIPTNVIDCREELSYGRRGKKDFHDDSSERRASTSARTESRSYPSPASISFSPLAKRRSSSFSCSDCSKVSTLSITAVARPLCVITRGYFESLIRFRTLAVSCLKSLTGMMSISLPILYLL